MGNRAKKNCKEPGPRLGLKITKSVMDCVRAPNWARVFIWPYKTIL